MSLWRSKRLPLISLPTPLPYPSFNHNQADVSKILHYCSKQKRSGLYHYQSCQNCSASMIRQFDRLVKSFPQMDKVCSSLIGGEETLEALFSNKPTRRTVSPRMKWDISSTRSSERQSTLASSPPNSRATTGRRRAPSAHTACNGDEWHNQTTLLVAIPWVRFLELAAGWDIGEIRDAYEVVPTLRLLDWGHQEGQIDSHTLCALTSTRYFRHRRAYEGSNWSISNYWRPSGQDRSELQVP